MNIDASAGVRGVAQPVVPVVDTADEVKPQVAPVEKSNDSAQTALDEKALQEKAKERRLSNEELAAAVEDIQSRLEVVGTRLGFSIHEETEDLVVEITNRESGELIRQIPSDEVLELRARLDELVGILFDKKA
ncbi:MAG: flagellar protein FlaG [Desulfobulbaceae bacterium]|nr:flagellar protein FlaG [Desulfobulbaceae bacterium]